MIASWLAFTAVSRIRVAVHLGLYPYAGLRDGWPATLALGPTISNLQRGGHQVSPWPLPNPLPLIMDCAYQDAQTRQLTLEFNWIPVVPPKSKRRNPWQYNQAVHRKPIEIEGLFRRLKVHFDKRDVVFLPFAPIVEALRLC